VADLEKLLRGRWWVACGLAGAAGWLSRDPPADLTTFADLGRQVLAGRFNEAYADPSTQAGPLQLVLSRVLMIGEHGEVPAAATRVVVDVALMVGALAAARGAAIREVAVAFLGLIWLLGPVPWSGHPVEAAVPVLWAYALMLSARDRWPAAGVVLGVSVLIAPLAMLGFACLPAVARPARTALVALGVALLGYLPFVLSGHFGMFGNVWPVRRGSLLPLIGLHEVTWATRLGQAVVVAAGCGLVAYLLRGRLIVVAAAPLTCALLRVATDPLVFDYYWVPVAVGSVLLVALLPAERSIWPFFAVGYGTLLAAATDQPALGALVCLAGYLAVGRTGRRGGAEWRDGVASGGPGGLCRRRRPDPADVLARSDRRSPGLGAAGRRHRRG
jgi:hypothetical protein